MRFPLITQGVITLLAFQFSISVVVPTNPSSPSLPVKLTNTVPLLLHQLLPFILCFIIRLQRRLIPVLTSPCYFGVMMMIQTPVSTCKCLCSQVIPDCKTSMRARGQVSPAFPLQTLLEWDAKCLVHTENWICKMRPVLSPKCRTSIRGCSPATGTETLGTTFWSFHCKNPQCFWVAVMTGVEPLQDRAHNWRASISLPLPSSFCNKELRVYL